MNLKLVHNGMNSLRIVPGKTVDIIIEMINNGINHRGKLRHALYAICLNKALEPNILTNKELIKMFNIKSKYLSAVSKNIENSIYLNCVF